MGCIYMGTFGNSKFFLVLDDMLNIIYSSEGIKKVSKTLINDLKIDKHIKENTLDRINVDNYFINIDKNVFKGSPIYFIEIESNKSNTEILKKAYTDSLTGLYNRNFWEDFIEGKIKLFKTKDYSGIIVIDIDNLKYINDFEGHLKGDKCIKDVSSIIKLNLSKNDLGIRYGGDEFIILTTKNDNMVNKLIFDIKYQLKNKNINISIGSSVICIKKGLKNAFKIADERMYNDKKNKYNKKILQEIEKLRKELNRLVKDDYRKTYDEVMHVSMKLDNLINKYMNLNKKNI